MESPGGCSSAAADHPCCSEARCIQVPDPESGAPTGGLLLSPSVPGFSGSAGCPAHPALPHMPRGAPLTPSLRWSTDREGD